MTSMCKASSLLSFNSGGSSRSAAPGRQNFAARSAQQNEEARTGLRTLRGDDSPARSCHHHAARRSRVGARRNLQMLAEHPLLGDTSEVEMTAEQRSELGGIVARIREATDHAGALSRVRSVDIHLTAIQTNVDALEQCVDRMLAAGTITGEG